MDDLALLSELEPVAEQCLERHLRTSKEWMPHRLVPWGLGEDFADDYQWDPSESQLSEVARSSLFVNLLTEDNLPYYFRDIERMFGRNGAWAEWNHRWTAEEGRHSIVIRDYLLVTRGIDPDELERGRMAQVSLGEVPEPPTAMDGLAYVCLQELATRIAHRNTGEIIDDPLGRKVMARVASDENFHFLFYRDVASAALQLDPNEMIQAIARNVIDFDMPGTGIPDFKAHSMRIAQAGIYDFSAHYDQILLPVVLRHWGVEHLEGLSGDGEKARDDLMAHIGRMERISSRLKDRREAKESAGSAA